MPVEERQAVFDNDGTLWCEKPMPVQLDFILRRLVAMAEAQPELQQRQPWAAAHQRDHGWSGQTVAEHYAGNDTRVRTLAARRARRLRRDEASRTSRRESDAFLRRAQHPMFDRGIHGVRLHADGRASRGLLANGFANYIASGGGRDFMRPVRQEVFGIPRERVIGSGSVLAYTLDERGGTIRTRVRQSTLDDGPQKPIRIWSRTGRRPLFAAGNSNGDIPMLDFTQRDDKPSMRLLILHDDPEREFAYTDGAEGALERADEEGWTVTSVKHDWKKVFSPARQTQLQSRAPCPTTISTASRHRSCTTSRSRAPSATSTSASSGS